MKQKIERVETHLYRRQYVTARGETRTLYYVNFVDWKQRRRSFPVGTDLKIAKEQKTLLEGRNIKREDFDADKLQRHKGIIFSEWAALYFKEKLDPDKRASGVERERRSFKELDKFFGPLPLASINRGKIREYTIKRQQEPIRRRDGKVVPGTRISFSTVNRELCFLRAVLNIAADEEIIETAPVMKLPSEAGRRRTRTVDPEEYSAIRDQLQRPQQRSFNLIDVS